MCSIGFHLCCSCDEEVKCDQPNSECPEFNGFPGQPCEKCEFWSDELRRDDMERDLERKRWEMEFLPEEEN